MCVGSSAAGRVSRVSGVEILIAVAVVAAVLLVALIVWGRLHLARMRRELAELRAEIARVEPTPAAQVRPSDEVAYVITDMDQAADQQVPAQATPERIDGRLFVDIVARESAVKAASYLHGLRRALAPETRNRIKFEMRRQRRQARKERRVEMREALREYRARRRDDGQPAEGNAA